MNPWEKYQSTDTPAPAAVAPANDGPWSRYGGGNTPTTTTTTQPQGITGKDIAEHPLVSLGKTLMQPAAQSLNGKSSEDMAREKSLSGGDVPAATSRPFDANLGDVQDTAFKNAVGAQAEDALSTPANYAGQAIVKGVAVPAVKAVAKAIPEGLKQSSYSLMQSIVNQLPKEFKYGANAGRAMVKEGLQGDAADIKDQSAAKIKEIGAEGDKLASSSNKPINNQNAIKIIDDKIAELQKNAPRENSSTITRLQNAKKDLLGAVEDENGNVISQSENPANMTPKQSLDFKRKFDYLTQWKGTASDDSIVNSTLQASRRAVKDNLNDAVPGMKEWNQRYADLGAANQAAARRVTYDQAGAGMNNMLNRFVRGSIAMSTLGAMITGNGELAGEVLAGWGAKEVLGNPMVKSKVAQMLYGLSQSDIKAVIKSVPWIKKLADSIKTPQQESVDSAISAGAASESFGGEKDAELLNRKRRGLPSLNPPGTALPSPKSVGRSPISMGTSYKPPEKPITTSPPKYGTKDANLLYGQMKAKENIPLHPSEDVRAFKDTIYSKNSPTMLAKNMGIKPEQVDHIADIKGMLESSEGGTNQGFSLSGGMQGERTHWYTKSNVPEFLKVKYSTNELASMLDNKLNGGKVTPGQSLVIKKLLKHFFPKS